MIINNNKRYIFIKTKKTAGTTLEIILSEGCTDNDVITPLDQEGENLRTKLVNVSPQNYYWSSYNSKLSFSNIYQLLRFSPTFYNHISAKTLIKRVKQDVWESYFKFCVERNPYDKVISMYYFMGPKYFKNFDQFLDLELKNLSDLHMYYDKDKEQFKVDRVLLYENLNEELKSLNSEFDLKLNLSLINTVKSKGNHKKKHINHENYLNGTQKNRIHNAFRTEFDLFGFE